MAVGLSVFGVLPHIVTIAADPPLMAFTRLLGSAFMVFSLVARRHSPLITLIGTTLGGVLLVLGTVGPVFALVTVPIVSYSVARFVPGKASRAVVYVGIAASVAGPLSWSSWWGVGYSGQDSVSLAILSVVCLGIVLTPYAVGRRAHDMDIAGEQQRMSAWQRHQLEIAEREQRIRSAEINARNQIARELHDIVAHSLSVMIVQAEGGKALARKQPEAAVESLDVIAETGRDALQEMRRIVGVLRSEPEGQAASYAPAPGLRDLPDLVRRTTDRAVLEMHGPMPDLPPALGLTVYRIVQEALTNFLKHAGPDAQCRVIVSFNPGRVDLNISDNGIGALATTGDGMGHGLRGMAERVHAMGGRFMAQPSPDGGFRVRATLPYHVRPPLVRQNDVRPTMMGR
jgi:signal transduction histidine kinase